MPIHNWKSAFRKKLDEIVEFMWGDGNTLMIFDRYMTEEELESSEGVKDAIARHMADVAQNEMDQLQRHLNKFKYLFWREKFKASGININNIMTQMYEDMK